MAAPSAAAAVRGLSPRCGAPSRRRRRSTARRSARRPGGRRRRGGGRNRPNHGTDLGEDEAAVATRRRSRARSTPTLEAFRSSQRLQLLRSRRARWPSETTVTARATRAPARSSCTTTPARRQASGSRSPPAVLRHAAHVLPARRRRAVPPVADARLRPGRRGRRLVDDDGEGEHRRVEHPPEDAYNGAGAPRLARPRLRRPPHERVRRQQRERRLMTPVPVRWVRV